MIKSIKILDDKILSMILTTIFGSCSEISYDYKNLYQWYTFIKKNSNNAIISVDKIESKNTMKNNIFLSSSKILF